MCLRLPFLCSEFRFGHFETLSKNFGACFKSRPGFGLSSFPSIWSRKYERRRKLSDTPKKHNVSMCENSAGTISLGMCAQRSEERAHPDLNLGLDDLQSAALATELCARDSIFCARDSHFKMIRHPWSSGYDVSLTR